MRTVFLIGYMCSGKTTLGRPLADALGVAFVDLDLEAERREGCTVSEIFARKGEVYFRRLEREVLEDAASGRLSSVGSVVACGGGTPLQPGLMELMNASGLTVWLNTPPERIVERLLLPGLKALRPTLAGVADDGLLDYVRLGLAERIPCYDQAVVHFDATRLESAAQVEETARHLAALLRPYL